MSGISLAQKIPDSLTNELSQINQQLDDLAAEPNLTAITETTLDPTGFLDRTTSAISFDNGTRTFTIAPTGASFSVYRRSIEIIINSARTIQIPNTSGMYFISFGADGQLRLDTQFSDTILNNYIFVSTAYWNVTKQSCEFLIDERHGLAMSWATHLHLHRSFGTRYYGGFGISFASNPLGTLNADCEIALSSGTIADEDIIVNIVDDPTPSAYHEQVLSPTALIPVIYRTGTEWSRDTAINAPVIVGTNRLYYNLNNNPTEATQDFVCYWIFAVPEIDSPIVSVMGAREDTTLAAAQQNNDYSTIDWGDLPSQEYKILYRLIYETNPAFSNAYKARLVDVQDLRGTIDSVLSSDISNPVGSHSALIGLNNDDHTQYLNNARGDVRYYPRTEISRFFNTTVITTSPTTTVLTGTSDTIILSGTSIDQIVNLGDATTYPISKTYNLLSNNDEIVNVVNSSGTTIIRLEPYNTVELVLLNNSTANGVWYQKLTFAPPNRGYNLREEFNTGTTTTGMTNWSNTASGSGAGATAAGTLFGRHAVYQLSTGTTNTGRIALHKSTNGTIFGNGIMFCYETQIYIPTLSTSLDRYLWTCGYGDNIVVGDHLDGIYFEYDELTSGNFWRLKTASNGTRTTTVTLTPVVAGTWIKLRIEVNRAGNEVLFFINNLFVGNITTNIPNAVNRNTDMLYKINKTVGAAARTVLVDYCEENTYLNR